MYNCSTCSIVQKINKSVHFKISLETRILYF